MKILKNDPVLFLAAFSVKSLINPDFNTSLIFFPFCFLMGYCEYLKNKKIEEINNNYIKTLNNSNESIKQDLELVKTKIATFQIAKGFQKRI